MNQEEILQEIKNITPSCVVSCCHFQSWYDTRNDLRNMFLDIIFKMSDYDNTRKWKDVDTTLFQRYFRAPPLVLDWETERTHPVVPTAKMHNIVLKVDVY